MAKLASNDPTAGPNLKPCPLHGLPTITFLYLVVRQRIRNVCSK